MRDQTRNKSPGFSRIKHDEKPSLMPAKGFQEWWVHVWSGLLRDSSGKHYQRIGPAIWLYLYLLLAGNWRTGTLFRRIDTIVEETGFSRRSVERWLHRLRRCGYIETRSNGRYLNISITKWRPVSRSAHQRAETNSKA